MAENEKEIDITLLKDIGKASAEAMEYAAKQVKPGAKLLDVAESAEKFLKDKGFGLAFPINLSVNAQAAHYTPSLDDDKVFGANDIVKVDFGAEKDGWLGDGAITVDLSGKHQEMVECANKALDNAISAVRHGVSVCYIGQAIAETADSYGFNVIKNLGGHGIHQHELHAELFIPNYDNGDFTTLEEGMVVAIEPFLTTGKGIVTDSDLCEIYSYSSNEPTRSQEARKLLQHLEKQNSREPFAVRWFSNLFESKFRLYAAVKELARIGAIEPHPTLVEISGGDVAQAEAQIMVTNEGCEIITRAKI
ncbi:MAG: type II methionyl aminopeptidase [Candidatus Micrarchaeaceae archaeon]|jgi:methionyl aminopeptidase